MSTPSSNFSEKARKLNAADEAAAKAQQSAEATAKEKQRRLTAEGSAIAQQSATEVIAQVRAQIIEAAQEELLRLPAVPQRSAALEIIVAGKWLLTGQSSGTQFTIGT